MTRLKVSVVVYPALDLPSRSLPVSLKIHCCLSVLLSTLLSGYTAQTSFEQASETARYG